MTEGSYGRQETCPRYKGDAGDPGPGRYRGPARRSGPAEASGMVRVSLQHRPLTASAALIWHGDLPRPLQQMLFQTADNLTTPAAPRPAELVALPSA